MALFQDAKNAALNEAMDQIAEDQENFPEEYEQEEGFFDFPKLPDLSILKAKTGEGSIEDYMQHALNFNKSRGTAQILRGCTGLFGELELAVIDIALGSFELIKEKRNVAE
jgi:hypothetical protein